jgi:hypothetical protein
MKASRLSGAIAFAAAALVESPALAAPAFDPQYQCLEGSLPYPVGAHLCTSRGIVSDLPAVRPELWCEGNLYLQRQHQGRGPFRQGPLDIHDVLALRATRQGQGLWIEQSEAVTVPFPRLRVLGVPRGIRASLQASPLDSSSSSSFGPEQCFQCRNQALSFRGDAKA